MAQIGRPTTPGKAGQKSTLSIRATGELKDKINNAAKANGRSLSQEAELRLERSFDIEDRFGGPQVVGLIETIATVMKTAGEHAGFIETRKLVYQGEWLFLPYAFDQATKAANAIMKHYKPKGKVTAPKLPQTKVVRGDNPKEIEKLVRRALENLGEGVARGVLDREEKK